MRSPPSGRIRTNVKTSPNRIAHRPRLESKENFFDSGLFIFKKERMNELNRKYLHGLSSDMDSPEDAIFFKATPKNIAVFLAAHRWAAFASIATVDKKTFLIARMGMIGTCPDQGYLGCNASTVPTVESIQRLKSGHFRVCVWKNN